VVALGSVPLVYALGHLGLLQLFVVTVVSGILTVFFDVAYQSYLPSLVGRSISSRPTPCSWAARR
jgi:hypothetical protein